MPAKFVTVRVPLRALHTILAALHTTKNAGKAKPPIAHNASGTSPRMTGRSVPWMLLKSTDFVNASTPQFNGGSEGGFLVCHQCNRPRLRNSNPVRQIIAKYWFDFDCAVGIETDSVGQARLTIDGDGWPAAWPLPPGTSGEEYYPEYPTLGQEEFEAFLLKSPPIWLNRWWFKP